MNREDFLFVHSKCCLAHWELVLNPETGVMHLECEKCGKPANVKIETKLLDAKCGMCVTTKEGN